MEWTRKELKEKAKFSVKAFYWKSVLVAFVLAVIVLLFLPVFPVLKARSQYQNT